MASQTFLEKMSVAEFAERFRNEMIPLSNTLSYFSAAPLSEEELKEYLDDPIAALPPSICKALPQTSILLVPYLEKAENRGGDLVSFEAPAENRLSPATHWSTPDRAIVALTTKAQDVGDYHYRFYRVISELLVGLWTEEEQTRYFTVLREELSAKAHGEVDEMGWHLKQALLRRQANVRRETKLFRDYASQSFVDTMTLYLHGICCDIDVETGPRQLPSRYLRKRLATLAELYPPPEGYAVFAEDASQG
jgi:hypothetical protein